MEFSFQYCSYLLKETLTFTQMCGMNSIPLTNRITFHSNNWLLLPDANQLYLNIWLSQTLTFIKKKNQKKNKLHLNISIVLKKLRLRVLRRLARLFLTNTPKWFPFDYREWNANIRSQETPGVIEKFSLGVQNEAG